MAYNYPYRTHSLVREDVGKRNPSRHTDAKVLGASGVAEAVVRRNDCSNNVNYLQFIVIISCAVITFLRL